MFFLSVWEISYNRVGPTKAHAHMVLSYPEDEPQ